MNFAYYCKKFFSLFYLGKTGLAAMAAGSILMCGFGSVGGPYTWNVVVALLYLSDTLWRLAYFLDLEFLSKSDWWKENSPTQFKQKRLKIKICGIITHTRCFFEGKPWLDYHEWWLFSTLMVWRDKDSSVHWSDYHGQFHPLPSSTSNKSALIGFPPHKIWIGALITQRESIWHLLSNTI